MRRCEDRAAYREGRAAYCEHATAYYCEYRVIGFRVKNLEIDLRLALPLQLTLKFEVVAIEGFCSPKHSHAAQWFA